MSVDLNFFENIKKIDNILTSNQVNEDVFIFFKNKKYETYFFNNVSSPVWFKILKEKGYFSPKNNPKPLLDQSKKYYQIPQWLILDYLEKVSLATRSFDKELIEIIKEISIYKDEEGKFIDNYRTWWFFVKILLNIPISSVPMIIFSNVLPIWLTSVFDVSLPGSDLTKKLLPIYLKQAEGADVKKAEKFIEILFTVKESKTKKGILGEVKEIQTKIDKYWLEESILDEENVNLIVNKCSNTPLLNLAKTIKQIFDTHGYEKYDHSYIWLNDLTQQNKKSLHEGEYFLANILRNLTLEKSKVNIAQGEELIKEFISDRFPQVFFKRLALLLISEGWNNYNQYFYQILSNKKENYFEMDSLYTELSYLLKKCAPDFSKKEKSKIASIISQGTKMIKHIPEDRRDEYKNIWKQKWYQSLIVLPEFRKLYDEIFAITKKTIVATRKGTGEWVNFDKSPISPSDLLGKTNTEILRYITEYKSTGDFPNASPEGVYQTFKSAVKLQPNKFTDNLQPFKTNNFHLLSELLDGLKEAWKEDKNLNWKSIFIFITELFLESWFWEAKDQKLNTSYNYFDWTISNIGELIQEGCKRDGRAFPEELNEHVEIILTTIIKNHAYNDSSYTGEGVSHALNSSWGKIVTAIIYLALREARLSDKRKENKISKWSLTLKNNFENVLSKNYYEAYTLLGQYLPNLHYVDKEWVEKRIKNIDQTEDLVLFETFMDGYLFSGRVYENLFNFLRKSYQRALKLKFRENINQERLVQHIAVSYLRAYDDLNTGIVKDLLEQNNPSSIRTFIDFLWHQRDYVLGENDNNHQIEKEKNSFRDRIIIFWDRIITLYQNKKILQEEDKKTISELSKLAVYLTEIDEMSFARLQFSAPYVTLDFDSPFFIEYLNNLKDKGNPKYVAKLFIAMIEGSDRILPDFDWNHIEEIIVYLYGLKNPAITNLTNIICTTYAEKGNLKLRKLYEKNNPDIVEA